MPCQAEQELWCIRRGDTVNFTFQFTDDDNNDAPIDISGKTLWFTLKLKAKHTDAEAALQHKVVFPNDSVSQNGIGYMTLEPVLTDPLTIKRHQFDFQLVDDQVSPAVVLTVGRGQLDVVTDITRSTQ